MENKNYNSIIHDTSAENNEIKIRLQQTSQDKDLLITRLKSDLESATKENFDSKRAIELLKQEKNTISSSLSSDINSKLAELSTKSSEIMRLSNENQQKDRELSSLQKKIIDQESELQSYQTQIHLLHTENSETKSSLESMRFDLEKLHLKITDQEFLYRSTKESALDWEDRFCRLNEENSNLKLEVNELQCKNRQLFDNLEKELSQRAKDYKERTMTMLMNPYRSNSPHMRPPTPMDQDRIRHISYIRSQTPVNEDRGSIDEFNGNTAAKLLQTLEDSPKIRSSNKTTLRTPTKEDIKSKIAQLMSNRTRLEHEIKMMDE
jgi:chromosome segregation ATPase